MGRRHILLGFSAAAAATLAVAAPAAHATKSARSGAADRANAIAPVVSDPGEEAGQRLTSLLVPPGDEPADGHLTSLANGIIGVLGSPTTGYTVVIGADEARSIADSEVFSGLSPDAQNMIHIEVAQVSAADLQVAWLRAIDKTGQLLDGKGGYAMRVDPSLRQVVVTVDRTRVDQQTASSIEAAAPGLVKVRFAGPIARQVRTVTDSPPHDGGALIWADYSPYPAPGGSCTAGFGVIRNSDNVATSVTAGHCGHSSGNGGDFYSGTVSNSSFYGTKAGNTGFPTYDMARLEGSTYSYVIRTNGGDDAYSQRNVRGAEDPNIGGNVCMSGAFSYAVCDIIVSDVDTRVCAQGGCTDDVAVGSRNDGGAISNGGDSGAPVYHRNGGSDAGIRGMQIVGGDCDSNLNNCRTIYFERWAKIQAHLDVRILYL